MRPLSRRQDAPGAIECRVTAIVEQGDHHITVGEVVEALNMLGKEQKNLAFTFFRPVDVSDGKISGQSFRKGVTGAPILVDALLGPL